MQRKENSAKRGMREREKRKRDRMKRKMEENRRNTMVVNTTKYQNRKTERT